MYLTSSKKLRVTKVIQTYCQQKRIFCSFQLKVAKFLYNCDSVPRTVNNFPELSVSEFHKVCSSANGFH